MANTNSIVIGDLDIDLGNYRLLRNGELIKLTPTEWSLLRELVNHPNQVLSHRTLLQRVWGAEYATEFDYVHTYISRLRRKIEADASNPEYIITEAGIGYRFYRDAIADTTNNVEHSTHRTDTVQYSSKHQHTLSINPLPQHIEERYVGRTDQRNQLKQLLLENSRLVGIYGRAGIGKTALACKVLGELMTNGEFSGMVFLSSTSTGITLGRIISDCNRLLDTDTRITQPDTQQTLYQITTLLDRLRDGNYILLLDNLEQLQDPQTNELLDEELATFFRVALEQGSTLRILVTSRYPLKLPRNIKIWERVISLEAGLTVGDGVDLLLHSDPDGNAGLRDTPDETLQKLVERTHGLPRALEAIVGILLESPLMTPEDLLSDPELLAEELGDLFIQGAIDSLSADALQVMEIVSIFERVVSLQLLEQFAKPHLQGKPLKPLLNRLIRAYFLSYSPDNQTVSMHPIDREYCYQRLDTNTRQSMHQQAAALYTGLSQDTPTIHHIGDIADALDAFHHLVLAEMTDDAARLLLQLDQNHLAIWGNYAELSDNYGQIVEHISDTTLQRQVLLRYGNALRRIGKLQEAITYLGRARTLAQGHDHDTANALGHLGWVHYDMGQFNEGLNHWKESIELYKAVGNRHGEGDLLGGMGWVSYLVGNYEDALTYIHEAFSIFGEIGNQLYRIGINIGDAGVIRTAQGDYTQAISNLRESLSIAETINALNEKSYKGGYLATALLYAGNPTEAESIAREATQYDVPANRQFVYAIHGITLAQLDRDDEAIQAFEQARDHAENLLRFTAGLYQARYAHALALAGLSLLRGDDLIPVIEDYGRAKAMCSTDGVIHANVRLLQALIDSKPHDDTLNAVHNLLTSGAN